MATTATVCNSFKTELAGMATHAATDTYKIALYTNAAASLDATTTVYTATGEITGTGYTAGGMALVGFNVTNDAGTAIIDFTTDPVWTGATITADTALIYNSSKSNKAVAVVKFTSASSTASTFTVQLPVPAAATGLVRIS